MSLILVIRWVGANVKWQCVRESSRRSSSNNCKKHCNAPSCARRRRPTLSVNKMIVDSEWICSLKSKYTFKHLKKCFCHKHVSVKKACQFSSSRVGPDQGHRCWLQVHQSSVDRWWLRVHDSSQPTSDVQRCQWGGSGKATLSKCARKRTKIIFWTAKCLLIHSTTAKYV